jgi:hypothetical protein
MGGRRPFNFKILNSVIIWPKPMHPIWKIKTVLSWLQATWESLRYDLTVPLGTWCNIKTILNSLRDIKSKLFGVPRPQKGRFREFSNVMPCGRLKILWQEVELVSFYDMVLPIWAWKGRPSKSIIENFIGYSGSTGADKLIDFTVALDKLEK